MSTDIFKTKFRAFQLDSEGSLFSFFKRDYYTLIEGRIPKGGIDELRRDLQIHGKTTIDTLHITSWDRDHCNYYDLIAILNDFRPSWIEVPDYHPTTNEAKLCQRIVFGYDKVHQSYVPNVRVISREYIRSLDNAERFGTCNIVLASSYDCNNKNDMSLIKLFRSEGFSVLSLGDCESADISERLQTYDCIRFEVDVLILPHHGADNGLTTGALLDTIKPKLAICSSNYDNQYDHPRPEICQLLFERGIPLMTTKTGDVFVTQELGSTQATAVNIKGNNTTIGATKIFTPKRERAAVPLHNNTPQVI